MASLSEIAKKVVDDGVATACSIGWAKRTSDRWTRQSGGDVRTIFDLASVTKPFTAFAVARSERVGPSTPLHEVLPEMSGTFAGHATLETLLSHRSGLAGHVPLFLPLVTGAPFNARDALVEAANGARAEVRGGAGSYPPVYSDLGYMLVGQAIARAHGAIDAGAVIEDLIAKPLALSVNGELALGTARSLSRRYPEWPANVAPTEMAEWRGGVVRGAVHDENAWALTGYGGSGHAGLFGDVESVLRFGEAAFDAIVIGEGVLAAGDLGWMVNERDGGTLRAGFDGKSDTGSSAGEKTSRRSFGHLGFTGTSLWIDPEAAVVLVILTNRVHPTRANEKIRAVRPLVNDALYDAAMRG